MVEHEIIIQFETRSLFPKTTMKMSEGRQVSGWFEEIDQQKERQFNRTVMMSHKMIDE